MRIGHQIIVSCAYQEIAIPEISDDLVYIRIKGSVVALDRASGSILWTNGLTGFGFGIATIVSSDSQQNLGALAKFQE